MGIIMTWIILNYDDYYNNYYYDSKCYVEVKSIIITAMFYV